MGRPAKNIDPEQVKKLAEKGWTGEEIAAFLGIHRSNLLRRFATHIKEGHLSRNGNLRSAQFLHALKGNAALLIWLGKQYLGQEEVRTVNHLHDKPAEHNVTVSYFERIEEARKRAQQGLAIPRTAAEAQNGPDEKKACGSVRYGD